MKTIKIDLEIITTEESLNAIKNIPISELEKIIADKIIDRIQLKPLVCNIKSFNENERKL